MISWRYNLLKTLEYHRCEFRLWSAIWIHLYSATVLFGLIKRSWMPTRKVYALSLIASNQPSQPSDTYLTKWLITVGSMAWLPQLLHFRPTTTKSPWPNYPFVRIAIVCRGVLCTEGERAAKAQELQEGTEPCVWRRRRGRSIIPQIDTCAKSRHLQRVERSVTIGRRRVILILLWNRGMSRFRSKQPEDIWRFGHTCVHIAERVAGKKSWRAGGLLPLVCLHSAETKFTHVLPSSRNEQSNY